MGTLRNAICAAAAAACLLGCGRSQGAAAEAKQPEAEAKAVPQFCADSAFAFVKAQTDFGPRVPGSEASRQCALWLEATLRRLGAHDIQLQRAQVVASNGDKLDICNISACFNPEAQKSILLLAHWDSRPWADQDPDPARRHEPIDGANDGASGVGVILELARLMQAQQPGIGVDVLFVDAEDYGPHAEAEPAGNEMDAWALGTQYWAQHPTLDTGRIQYAVLLDMVGGQDAVFSREGYSDAYSRSVVDLVWRVAKEAGYAARFVQSQGNPIIDDHVYLLQTGMPAIDIIESNHPLTGSFNPTWHTMADNIDNISPATLQAVGQTLTNLIYR